MKLLDLTLAQASQKIHAREVSARELADYYLTRIEQLNPKLNTFITLTADAARADAQRADDELARGDDRGALHGIPFALKDLFDTRGVRTTAGAKILRERVPNADAEVVARLRAGGATRLGKLNMHEWAFGVTNDNPHFGRVLNPWDESRVTGGSSGGSAAAIAARLCLGTLGTDTGGSIRIPASLCGVTGLKPTFGRVSVRGVIPLSWSMDHVGPLAQTAEDCALILQTIAGYDPRDALSANVPVPDYAAALNHALNDVRLARAEGYFADDVDAEILAAVEEGTRVLAARGARVMRKPMPFAQDLFRANRAVLRAEAAVYHAENMQNRAGDYGVDVLKRLQDGATISTAEYIEGTHRKLELTRALELYFDDVDVLLTPTTRVAAPRAGGDAVAMAQHLTAFTGPFNLTGFPALSVPCGFTREGLPIGLQLVARPWNEALLLNVAHQFQRATDWHTRRPME